MNWWLETMAALVVILGLFGFLFYIVRKAQREDTLRRQDSAEPGGFYTDFVGDLHHVDKP